MFSASERRLIRVALQMYLGVIYAQIDFARRIGVSEPVDDVDRVKNLLKRFEP